PALGPVAEVGDAGDAAGIVVDADTADMAVGPDLGAMGQRVGDVRDERAGLGVDFAALQAETAVDAVRTVAEPAVGDGYRAYPGLDAGGSRTALKDLTVATGGMGGVRIAVRIPPWPVLAGDGQFRFDGFGVGPERAVIDRPVSADTVTAEGVEVGRVEARRVAGVVHHRAADAAAGVVGSERHWIASADLSRLRPEEAMGTPLVADPISVGIPEGSGIEAHDLPPGTRETLGQDGTA